MVVHTVNAESFLQRIQRMRITRLKNARFIRTVRCDSEHNDAGIVEGQTPRALTLKEMFCGK